MEVVYNSQITFCEKAQFGDFEIGCKQKECQSIDISVEIALVQFSIRLGACTL